MFNWRRILKLAVIFGSKAKNESAEPYVAAKLETLHDIVGHILYLDPKNKTGETAHRWHAISAAVATCSDAFSHPSRPALITALDKIANSIQHSRGKHINVPHSALQDIKKNAHLLLAAADFYAPRTTSVTPFIRPVLKEARVPTKEDQDTGVMLREFHDRLLKSGLFDVEATPPTTRTRAEPTLETPSFRVGQPKDTGYRLR